ncbi:MAG TPA: HNH endonuclease [Nocardioides sp.]|nr:HNH endonuclease [Nocardioides sp.]
MPAHAASDLTADHVVPKARGGSDDPENIQVLCRGCNSRKHSRQ